MTQFPGVSQGKVGRVEERRTVLAWTVATGDAKRRGGGESRSRVSEDAERAEEERTSA